MPVTIQLNDDLAAQLRQKAAARRQSLEEFAQHLLDDALGQLDAADVWAAQNRRRLDLIRRPLAEADVARPNPPAIGAASPDPAGKFLRALSLTQ